MKILFILLDILIIVLPIVLVILIRNRIYRRKTKKPGKNDFEPFMNTSIYLDADEERKRLKHIDDKWRSD